MIKHRIGACAPAPLRRDRTQRSRFSYAAAPHEGQKAAASGVLIIHNGFSLRGGDTHARFVYVARTCTHAVLDTVRDMR